MAAREATQAGEAVFEAYCPHCHLLVEDGLSEETWPPHAERCPHCRLLIGSGRCVPTPDAEPGARGTAAGLAAQRAKQHKPQRGAPAREIRRAIRLVAEELGARPERLLMIDYQQQAQNDDRLPPLDDVFAAFGSWKRARREAA